MAAQGNGVAVGSGLCKDRIRGALHDSSSDSRTTPISFVKEAAKSAIREMLAKQHS